MSAEPQGRPTVPDHLPLALRVEYEAEAYRRVRTAPARTRTRSSRWWTRARRHRMTPVVGAALMVTISTLWALAAGTPMAVTTAIFTWWLAIVALVAVVTHHRLGGHVRSRLEHHRTGAGAP